MDNRIPVTIITGFLGAGKTTFLNRLIKDYPEKKFAIIENEFGEIGIDSGLIESTDENIFELSNGCICCSLNEGFYETIAKLLNSEFPFNHLLIETTGIADPDSIIKAFLSSEDIQLNFRIDSVICLADCSNLQDLIDKQSEVKKQLALADVVLLNKSDTVQQEHLKELESRIGNINPMAARYPAQFAKVKDLNLIDLNTFSAKAIENTTLSFKNLSFVNDYTNYNSTLSKPKDSSHKHNIQSFGFVIPGSFDLDKFNLWIDNFLFFNKNTVFRVKGILSFKDMPERQIFQAVKNIAMAESGSEWGKDMRFSKLVFIGTKLNHDQLEDSLYKLLATY